MADEVADGWARAALVVGAVARRNGEILLVHEHTLGGAGPDQWVLPGGRVEPGELLDAAVKREVREETGYRVDSVGSLAFGIQQYVPAYADPLLWLVFNVELSGAEPSGPSDPDGLIMEARFVPIAEAVELVVESGDTPGGRSTADFLSRASDREPMITLWDLNRSATAPLGQLPTAPDR